MSLINPHAFILSDVDAVGFSLIGGIVNDFKAYMAANSGELILYEDNSWNYFLNKDESKETLKFCISWKIGHKYIIVNPIDGSINGG